MGERKGRLVIAGGGIGGLAAALSASRAGWGVQLFERAAAFSERGAGIQLSPNVTRLLRAWGLEDDLRDCAAMPPSLEVRSARSGALLAELPLGNSMVRRYGAPYLTVLRADLHALLLQSLRTTDTGLHLNRALQSFSQSAETVRVETADGPGLDADVLVGADGLWSRVREQWHADGLPHATGHRAYRALLPMADLPHSRRSLSVTVWLGPRMHVVQYPVRGGELLNVVVLVDGTVANGPESWEHPAQAHDVALALTGCCDALCETVALTTGAASVSPLAAWRWWSLYDRPPLSGAHQMAQGRVALLGDAAHPMLPYLAQGAGMALEDAAALGRLLALVQNPQRDGPDLLQRYAHLRWQRNARVQAQAQRNGRVFHAQGLMRWGRDAALKLRGAPLLDMPWLYAGGSERLARQ